MHLVQTGEQLPSVFIDNLPVQFGKSLIAGAYRSENSRENGNFLIDLKALFEPRHEKTRFLHMRKQRRRPGQKP